jgi:hypothetical protein
LEFAVLPFGPCLIFDACDLGFASFLNSPLCPADKNPEALAAAAIFCFARS